MTQTVTARGEHLLHALHLLGSLLVVAAKLSDQIQDLANVKPHGDSFCGARVDGCRARRRGTYTATLCRERPRFGKRRCARRDCGAGIACGAQPPLRTSSRGRSEPLPPPVHSPPIFFVVSQVLGLRCWHHTPSASGGCKRSDPTGMSSWAEPQRWGCPTQCP